MSSYLPMNIDLVESLHCLYSTGLKLLEEINNIPAWLSSLPKKVSVVAIERFAKNALTFAQNTLGFIIRAGFTISFLLLHPGPFLVGLGFGIFSDTARAKAQRVSNIFNFYLLKGPLLKRIAIAATVLGLAILAIPYSDIAVSIYLGCNLGIYLRDTVHQANLRSSSSADFSQPPSLSASLSALPQDHSPPALDDNN